MASLRVLGWLGVLGSMAGCARAVNLVQPDSPRFDGQFAGTPPTAPAGPIRVATFNLHLSRFVDRAIRVLDGPGLKGADLISLQEMDDVAADQIARALRLNYVYFPAAIHPTRGRYFGPAIMSPWPIDTAWKLLLPHVGSVRGQRRTATVAVVTVRGVRLRVYAVHLETQARLTANEYLDQAATIVADAATSPDPVIIAGDFNGREIGRYLEAKGYHWPTRHVGRTSYLFSLDHVFVRGLAVAEPTAASVKEVLGASDHRPVWASVLLPGTPTTASGSHP